jgi:hypothetical protein
MAWKATLAVAAVLLLTTAGCENGNDATTDHDRRAPRAEAVSLPCRNSIESLDRPTADGDHTVVLGRVGLPTRSALGVNRTAEDPEFPLFAKDGLVIKAGTSFELIVPRRWRDRLRIGWGSPAQPTARLRVAGCQPIEPSKPWLAYTGGYFVKERACVSLVVKAANQTRRVRIGVGAACPGQDPPP